MRVVHLLASTGWGGAERMGCTLHRLTRENGHESHVDAVSIPELKRALRDETGDELPARESEDTHFRWMLGARRRVRSLRPDIVHAQLATPGLLSACAWIAGSTPFVATFQLLPRKAWPKDYLLRVPSPAFLRGLLALKRRRVLVAVSDTDRERLRDVVGSEAVRVVRNIPPLPPISAAADYRPTWPDGVVRLLSVGRLHPQKGFDGLLAALADPRLRELSWHWLIVGEGEQRAELEAAIERAGLGARVTLAGAQPSQSAIRSADLVLSPSRWEGMPLVPLEAVLAGTPVVVSTISPHLEFFRDVGDSFLPENEAAWSSSLVALVRDESARRRLRDAQSALAAELRPQRLWDGYSAIYRELLAS